MSVEDESWCRVGKRISDLKPLSNLGGLEMLHLGQNQVENLSALAGLVKLEKLNLSGNLIVGLHCLRLGKIGLVK